MGKVHKGCRDVDKIIVHVYFLCIVESAALKEVLLYLNVLHVLTHEPPCNERVISGMGAHHAVRALAFV